MDDLPMGMLAKNGLAMCSKTIWARRVRWSIRCATWRSGNGIWRARRSATSRRTRIRTRTTLRSCSTSASRGSAMMRRQGSIRTISGIMTPPPGGTDKPIH